MWFKGVYGGLEGCYFLLSGLNACLWRGFRDIATTLLHMHDYFPYHRIVWCQYLNLGSNNGTIATALFYVPLRTNRTYRILHEYLQPCGYAESSKVSVIFMQTLKLAMYLIDNRLLC